MAAHVPIPPGLPQTQKPGTRIFTGTEECALRHAAALAPLALSLRPCYGPRGGLKLLTNRLGKVVVTGSAGTVLAELELEHPAGVLARQACETQARECGEGAGAVLLLAAALMAEAEVLLRAGVPAPELCRGFRLARAQAAQKLEALSFTPGEECGFKAAGCWSADVLPAAPPEGNSLSPSGASAETGTVASGNSLSPAASATPAPTPPEDNAQCHPQSATDSKTSASATESGTLASAPPGGIFQSPPLPPPSLSTSLGYALASAMLDHGTALGRLAAWASTGDGGPETLRVLGFLGGTLEDSWVLRGAVMPLEPLGTRRQTGSARLALYLCPFGEQKTRAAGTARLCGARELEELGPGRERVEEARVEALIQAGVTVLAVAGAVSELALHFCDRAGLLAVRLERRSQARELELATGARALLADHRAPEDEELGRCQRVYPSEIGGQPVVVFEPRPGAGKGLVTVVVRGATEELLGAAEEAVRGAVQCCRALREEPRMVAGAGAAEVEVSLHLEALGRGQPGLEQHGLLAFARALETLPRALARNWGLDEARAMGELRARHLAGETGAGVGEEEDGAPPAAVLDPLVVKRRAIELATEVAVTLLGCGQVVVAKKSGGPRFRGDNPNWDLEPDLIDCETP